MLTQLVRYGRMLKVEMRAARCHVEAHWTSEGSVFAGTIGSTCHRVVTRVEVESDDDPARIAALIRNAEGGCYAQSALQRPVPVEGTATLNGEPIDYEQYPRRVPRR
jgi:organic hydroperoxide reductase OsmC/OhrA